MDAFFQNHFWEIIFAIVAAASIPIALTVWSKAKNVEPPGRRPFSGPWEGKFKTQYDGTENVAHINLRSLGPIVHGTSVLSWEENAQTKTARYKIFGLQRDKILAASYWKDGRVSSDRGVFLVRLDLDGDEGDGMITGFEGGYDHLESSKCFWKRIKP